MARERTREDEVSVIVRIEQAHLKDDPRNCRLVFSEVDQTTRTVIENQHRPPKGPSPTRLK